MKILISTASFGDCSDKPFSLLKENDIEYNLNPYNRKMSEEEIYSLIPEYEILIAGTEKLSKKVLENAKNLKLISRVGVGLDNIDLEYAKKNNIKVSYTPTAPSFSVAELSLTLILSLLRNVQISNLKLHAGIWHRELGRSLSELSVGVIGAGRIGKELIKLLSVLDTKEILVNDIKRPKTFLQNKQLRYVNFEDLLKKSDIISIHLPLNKKTRNLFSKNVLLKMKKNAILINTSRGGIINEKDLYEVLQDDHLSGVGLDVFENEPYFGKLSEIDRALLTAHLGPMSFLSRSEMESQATEEAIRFLKGEDLLNLIPTNSY